MKVTRESANKAKELLEDQSVFLSEECHDYLRKFINAVIRKVKQEAEWGQINEWVNEADSYDNGEA